MPNASSPLGAGVQAPGPTDLLLAAQHWGGLGYRVHPCDPETKRPLTRWSESASTHPDIIGALWRRWPDALIAVCTGNGLVVVDDDRGEAAPEEDMAQTLTAKTRSRGWHHYFRDPTSIVGNRVGIIPGVDIRGAGGYVIAPPSPGWAWYNEAPVQTLPEWVVTLMSAHHQRGRGFGRGFAPASELIQEGSRNDYIARFAGYVLRLELAVNLHQLKMLCLEENERIIASPLPVNEVMNTAASIWRADQRRNG